MKISTLKKWARAGLILLLVLCLAFTGLGAPGFLLGLFPEQDSEKEEARLKALDEEPLGNSKPVTVEVGDIFRFEAPENTFEKDTEVKIEEVSEETLEKLGEDFSAAYPSAFATFIEGWEVDAGMKPEERTPGSFTMSVRLDKLDIPEEYWDDVYVYRIDGDNNWFQYASERNGKVLSVTSHQNSMVVLGLVISGVAVPIGNNVIPELAAMGGQRFIKSLSAKQYAVYEVPGDSRSRVIMYINFATDEVFERLEKRLVAIEGDTLSHFKGMEVRKMNSEISRRLHCDPSYISAKMRVKWRHVFVEEALAVNPEYQKIQEELKTHQKESHKVENLTGLDLLQRIGDQGLNAYNYIKTQSGGVRMPSYAVQVHLVNSTKDFAGVTTPAPIGWLKNPFICLNMSTFDGCTEASFLDGVLLTMTHELLHVCQREYKHGSFSCLKYDEATAQMIQLESRDWYRKNGVISTPQPDTDENYDKTDLFVVPLDDYDVSYGNSKGGSAMSFDCGKGNELKDVDLGYPLARFLLYLRDKYRPRAGYDDLLWPYTRYTMAPDLTEMLKSAFYLSDESLTRAYYEFALENRHLLGQKATAQRSNWGVISRPVEPDRNNPITVTNHNYTIRYHRFKPEIPEKFKGSWKLLIATDQTFKETMKDVRFCPSGNWGGSVVKTEFGLLSSLQQKPLEDGYLALEIDGGLLENGWFSTKTGMLQAFLLTAPHVKEPSAGKNGITFTLPERSPAGKAECLRGYSVKISISGEEPVTKRYELRESGEVVSLRWKDLIPKYKGDEPEELGITLEYCEYLKRSGGAFAYGPATVKTINGGAEEKPTDPTETTEPTEETRPQGSGAWKLTDVLTGGEMPGEYSYSFSRENKTSMGKIEDDFTVTGTITYTYAPGAVKSEYKVSKFEGFTHAHEGSCMGEYGTDIMELSTLPDALPEENAEFVMDTFFEASRQSCYRMLFQGPRASVYWSDSPEGYSDYICVSLDPDEVVDVSSAGDDSDIRQSTQKYIYRFSPSQYEKAAEGDKRYLVIMYFVKGGSAITAYEFTYLPD